MKRRKTENSYRKQMKMIKRRHLPKDWNGLAIRKEFEGGCSYHQKKSYDLMGDGVLFHIQIAAMLTCRIMKYGDMTVLMYT